MPYGYAIAGDSAIDNLVVSFALYLYRLKLVAVVQAIESVVQQHVGTLTQATGTDNGNSAVGIVICRSNNPVLDYSSSPINCLIQLGT